MGLHRVLLFLRTRWLQLLQLYVACRTPLKCRAENSGSPHRVCRGFLQKCLPKIVAEKCRNYVRRQRLEELRQKAEIGGLDLWVCKFRAPFFLAPKLRENTCSRGVWGNSGTKPPIQSPSLCALEDASGKGSSKPWNAHCPSPRTRARMARWFGGCSAYPGEQGPLAVFAEWCGRGQQQPIGNARRFLSFPIAHLTPS